MNLSWDAERSGRFDPEVEANFAEAVILKPVDGCLYYHVNFLASI